MTEKILSAYKQNIKGLELEPSGGGCFEVYADDALIYSKLETGEFPNEDSVVSAIGEKI